MQRHIILTFFGIVLAIALVAWVRPETTGGTAFLVVITLLAVNAIGAIVGLMRRRLAATAPVRQERGPK